jgi:HSP20 family protein
MLIRYEPLLEFRPSNPVGGPAAQPMPLDAYRRGAAFFVHVDVPGIDADRVELVVEHDTLTIKATRAWERKEGDQILAIERPEGEFVRHLMLGSGLDADRIEARIDRGVLTLRIPVATEGGTRTIPVVHAGPNQDSLRSDGGA